MNWYLGCLKKYADFTARARRKELWMFILFFYIFGFVALALDCVLGTGATLGSLYMLAMMLPCYAVAARRLHDTNRSGWWMLIGFVPIVGGIWLFVLMVLDGNRGANRFGADPKAA